MWLHTHRALGEGGIHNDQQKRLYERKISKGEKVKGEVLDRGGSSSGSSGISRGGESFVLYEVAAQVAV